jgi:xylulokinase
VTDHVFTIDLGTSGPKVALFTIEGDYVDGAFRPVDLVLGAGGAVEQRPADWWAGIVAGAQELAARRAIDPSSIVAVSVTSQWSGTVAVDAASEPLADAIIWMDSRGAAATKRLVGGPVKIAGYDPRKLRAWIKYTGGAPAHSGKDPISHIAWIESERPELAARTAKYLEPKDWLNARLTGRVVATYDSIVVHWLTDNRDPVRVAYVDELIARSGVPRAKFPDLIAATDVVGPLRDDVAIELGLPPGIPVIGGTPDVQSAAIGSGAVRDGEGHLYIGTSSWITCHVSYKKTDLQRGIASLPSPLPGKYFVADEQETAGKCLEFLRDHILWPVDALGTPGPPDDAWARIDALAATAPPGANGVMFTPWLVGERTPVDDHTLRAAWSNVDIGTTRADLARAVLEGVALNTRWLLESVEKFTGTPFPWLHFIGGGAVSSLWAQIIADVLQREMRVVANPVRANARGAALLAALALGHTTVDEIARTVPIAATYTPTPANAALYDERYTAFRAFHKANKRIYRTMNGHDR